MNKSLRWYEWLIGGAILTGIVWYFLGNTCSIIMIILVFLSAIVDMFKKSEPLEEPKEPEFCELCGNALKRASYRWMLDGGEKVVCSHCNSALERKRSRRATRDL
jgi:hypothetical protein